MIKIQKDDLTTFKYKDIEFSIDLNALFTVEWQKVLLPLFNTEYFAGLMYYVRHYYVEKPDHAKMLSPFRRSALFTPFLYLEPNDVKAVLILDAPASRLKSNGIGFGTTSVNDTITYTSHLKYFSKLFGCEHTVDPTLISWLKQGVLVLNKRPMMHEDLPSFHNNIFDYVYKNVINYLFELDTDLIVATNSRSAKDFVKTLHLKDLVELHCDGFFPLEGMSIYDKINTQLIVYGEPTIRWSKKL